jgi:hypothetical protein
VLPEVVGQCIKAASDTSYEVYVFSQDEKCRRFMVCERNPPRLRRVNPPHGWRVNSGAGAKQVQNAGLSMRGTGQIRIG